MTRPNCAVSLRGLLPRHAGATHLLVPKDGPDGLCARVRALEVDECDKIPFFVRDVFERLVAWGCQRWFEQIGKFLA